MMGGEQTSPVVDDDIVARCTETRRAIHQAPELAFEERQTAGLIADRLKALGLDVTPGIAGTGVVGVLSRGDGSMVAFRADMDALPIEENSNLAYRSRTPGKMHACGHDGHTAVLLGAAEQLARSGQFSGSIAFIFQPAEENEAGAKAMLEDGLFERFPIQAIYGTHNFPGVSVGAFCTRAGPMMASFNKFEIMVTGSGGHSSQPHRSSDALRAAAAIARDLPDIARRNLDPFYQAVVSVTALHSDGGYNVIPGHAALKGSFRAMDAEANRLLCESIAECTTVLARLHGCTADMTLFPAKAYPVTANSVDETQLAVEAASRVGGAGAVDGQMHPLFASEDFAFYLEVRGGNFMGYGNGGSAPLHTAQYDFNDDAIPFAIAYWWHLAHCASGIHGSAASAVRPYARVLC